MQPPDELMVQLFLPSIRQLVSAKLRSEGYSQSKISNMLGITQASVSMYLASKPDRAYSSLSELSTAQEDADRYASILAEDVKKNPIYAVETLTSIWTGLLGGASICAAHRKQYPALAQCDVCVRQFGPSRRETSKAVEQVSRAVRTIENSPVFVRVMPQVSVNIASVDGESTSPEDVVAIPGRIVRVKNTAKAFFPPEFGASKHMARILLLVRRRMPQFHAAINLTYNRKMAGVLRKLGLRTMAIGGSYPLESEDPTADALASRLLQSKDRFDAVVDSGGKGIEPSLYLFGKNATEVASLAVRIAELYSAG